MNTVPLRRAPLLAVSFALLHLSGCAPPGTSIDCIDEDADGFCAAVDCDDASADISPGAEELACNGVDDDCLAATPDDPDIDMDGVGDVCDHELLLPEIP